MSTFPALEDMDDLERDDHLIEEHKLDDEFVSEDLDHAQVHRQIHRTGQLIGNPHTHAEPGA